MLVNYSTSPIYPHTQCVQTLRTSMQSTIPENKSTSEYALSMGKRSAAFFTGLSALLCSATYIYAKRVDSSGKLKAALLPQVKKYGLVCLVTTPAIYFINGAILGGLYGWFKNRQSSKQELRIIA